VKVRLAPTTRDLLARKLCDAPEAVSRIRSGDRVYIGSNCAQPLTLCEAMVARAHELSGVEIVHLITFGPAPYADPALAQSFRHLAFFIGPNTRASVQGGHADYMPIFLSEIPNLFSSGQMPIDVAMVSVSPPDEHGFCSLGISIDVGLAACRNARIVIAEINENMPRTLGQGFLHLSDIDAVVMTKTPLLEHVDDAPDEVSRAIGRHVATLIDDGATLQTGIGSIPGAVLEALRDKNDLGVHTEMFGDAVVAAIQRGNITCRKKSLHPNKVVSTFCFGSHRLYRYLHDNPLFEFAPTEYVNDPNVIALNVSMIAINSAIEVDLTGQVVADSIGSKLYSGIGGQVDFIRGASRSIGGKPIIALPSTAKGGAFSRIVSRLRPGAGVVTSRGDVHYIVTEFGAAYLHGKCLRERALSLIRIAHPDFRDQLLEEAKELGLVPKEQPSVEHTFPEDMVKTIQIASGETVILRPILPTDEQMLKKHFYSLSPETVHRRFNRMVRTLTNGAVRDLVNVDYRRHMAMVAVQRRGRGEKILATSRYYLDDTTNTAEIAFAVLDDWQGKGIGRALLTALIEHAARHRVGSFVAWVQPDNFPMLRLLQNCGVPAEQKLVDGQYRVTMKLQP